jgi:hypothetical protein
MAPLAVTVVVVSAEKNMEDRRRAATVVQRWVMRDAKTTVDDDTRVEDMTTIVPAEATLEVEATATTDVKSLVQAEVTQEVATTTTTARAVATVTTGATSPVPVGATQVVTTIMTAHPEVAAMEATLEATADQVATEVNTLRAHPTAAAVAMVVPRTISQVRPSMLRASLETAATTICLATSSVCCPARRTSSRMRM